MSEDDEVDELIRELEGLRIRREELLDRLAGVRRRRENEGAIPPLVVGDRVRILNRVRRPNGWPPAPNDETDQLGIVTRVTSSRIYIATDTGVNTWRARTNVTRIGR